MGVGGHRPHAFSLVVLLRSTAPLGCAQLGKRAGTGPTPGSDRQAAARTFRIEEDATAFLAEIGTSESRCASVPPHAGRTLVAQHAAAWNTGIAPQERRKPWPDTRF
jgi:hypothetical protein